MKVHVIYKTWIKAIALILSVISVLVFACSAVVMVWFASNGWLSDNDNIYSDIRSRISRAEARRILDSVYDDPEAANPYACLEGNANFAYAVVKTDGSILDDTALEDREYLYVSSSFDETEEYETFRGYEGRYYVYGDQSAIDVLMSSRDWWSYWETESDHTSLIYVLCQVTDQYATTQGDCDRLLLEGERIADILAYINSILVEVFWGSLICMIAFHVFLLAICGRNPADGEMRLRLPDKLPWIVVAASLTVAGAGIIVLGISFMLEFHSYTTWEICGIFTVLMLLSGILLFEEILITTAVRIKAHAFWKTTLLYRLCNAVKVMAESAEKHVSLYFLIGGFEIILTSLELMVLAYDSADTVILAFVLYKLVAVPIVFWLAMQYLRLKNGAERIASGNFEKSVDDSFMLPGMKKFASDLNSVSIGIQQAVTERTKSERMKAELITNVSHDIKTPLTSVINYTDLLSREDIENPTAREYIETIAKHSQRLKRLLQDLIDASRAATGNVELHMEILDVGVLMDQMLGEYRERMADKGLNPCVKGVEEGVPVQADQKQLFRVFDNLLGNIIKYSLAGTRVYIDLERREKVTLVILKNISETSLNISADELTERFVRGDASRNTEGSGLGLSIAKSLMHNMGGELTTEIDGDLFKVTIELQNAVEEEA